MTGIERETLPEVGGILHLDHVNFQVSDHDLATVFFVNGLGLTRDPYRRVDETNMGVNVGLQQFHLPRRGPTPPFLSAWESSTVPAMKPILAAGVSTSSARSAAFAYACMPPAPFLFNGRWAYPMSRSLSRWVQRMRSPGSTRRCSLP
jgi:hypothetical protein